MSRKTFSGLDKKRLRRWLTVFFLALAIPTAILIYQAYSQLKWEAFHQNRLLADELVTRIDNRLIEQLYQEENRSFSDYSFLVVAGDPAANFVQRSPLSKYPVNSGIPGLIGYFQVDADGAFSTPLLPQANTESSAFGITPQQAQQRLALQNQIRQILSENRLVQGVKAKTTAAAPQPQIVQVPVVKEDQQPGLGDSSAGRYKANESLMDSAASSTTEKLESQAAFDQLKVIRKDSEKPQAQETARNLGRVEDLKLDKRFQKQAPEKKSRRQILSKSAPQLEKRVMRKEQSALLEAPTASEALTRPQSRLRIRTFESEIDPFEFSLLGSGHFVLFRKVWRDGQRYIQGAIIEQQSFLHGIIETVFQDSAIAQVSNLIVAYQGNVISVFNGHSARAYFSRASDLTGELLHQSRLSAPLSDMELIFSVTRLPPGPGATIIHWLAGILFLFLCGGFYLMYRLGIRQIELTRQQQDFVSAVSHELKTPLTSIRMYGEMLRAGWTNEDKKTEYYDYIYNESERLSRLINNVLQLARMTRNDLKIDLKMITAGELVDVVRSKVSSQMEQAGFNLNLQCDDAASQANVSVDEDYFTQIIINLVDNAIKFSAKANTKTIDISCQLERDRVVFAVRDYGPGVGKDQMKKIFKLFYRSENELTRETVGTGIGLALVQQLAQTMQGQVDIINRQPGAEFRLSLPLQHPSAK
jgi:signal transduction histidine kinase